MANRSASTIYSKPPENVLAAMKKSASLDYNEAALGMREVAKAIETPLKQGIMAGKVGEGIFAPFDMPPGTSPEFTIDPLTPGTEKEYVAYTIPYQGGMPNRTNDADYVSVSTFEVGNTIDWPLRLVRDGRYDVVNRSTQIFESGFIKKWNDDCFRTLITAAASRGVLVWDGNAGAGRLSLGLINKMTQQMRRLAGGNATSLKRGKMTDMWLSLEGFQDMRSWTLAEVDEATRQKIFSSVDGGLSEVYGVTLHELFELGVNQEYQLFYTSTLGGTLHSGDIELAIGVDLFNNDAFINPIRSQLEVFENMLLHPQRRGGIYGWTEYGMVCLDNRRVIIGSY